MENQTTSAPLPDATPPRLLPAFVKGFNTVAGNIYLILLPVLVDLILWFGPHLRIKNIFLPLILEAIQTVRETSTPQAREMLTGMEELWRLFLEHYNLLSNTSTFPLGVPSVMVGQSPLLTPLGQAAIIEVSAPLLVPAAWLFFSLVGFALGSLYFASLANSFQKAQAAPMRVALTPRVWLWQTMQMILLVVLLTILLVIVFIPTLLIASVLVLLSPALSWIVLLGVSFLAVWMLIPLMFTPHGIFALGQNVMNSALLSARLVRQVLPGTGLFLLIAIVLYQGLGVLWRIPTETSWMALVGVLGHAFTGTGVVASSFAYYLSCLNWIQATARRAAVPNA